MAESFSRHVLRVDMGDLDDSVDVLDILQEILETERTFYATVRFLEGQTRNHIVAAHMRNMGTALHILRTFTERPAPTPQGTVVMNIDLSGNVLRNFLEPVPVVPTAQQLAAGTERDVAVGNETCPICRDAIVRGTRLRACGHIFHSDCIDQWFGLNTRCPVCRHDVREPAGRLRTPSPPARGRRTYSEYPDQA